MRFSLRTLLILLAALPLFIGGAVWTLWPERGTPRRMREFERALKTGHDLESAVYYCFVPGLPAKHYQTLLDKADGPRPGTELHWRNPSKTATFYLLSGGDPDEDGRTVLVIVDRQPPAIVGAAVENSTFLPD
jgi:hypothetical protein